MPSASVQDQRGLLRLQSLPVAAPWQALLLPVSGFPLAEAEVAAARILLERLTTELCREAASSETFIRFSHLHLGDGASRVASRGSQWMPMMGLGVWPDREPPTTWKLEELMDLAPGEKTPLLMDIVLRITGPPETRTGARDVMLGLGTVIQFVIPEGQDLLGAAESRLKPAI